VVVNKRVVLVLWLACTVAAVVVVAWFGLVVIVGEAEYSQVVAAEVEEKVSMVVDQDVLDLHELELELLYPTAAAVVKKTEKGVEVQKSFAVEKQMELENFGTFVPIAAFVQARVVEDPHTPVELVLEDY